MYDNNMHGEIIKILLQRFVKESNIYIYIYIYIYISSATGCTVSSPICG